MAISTNVYACSHTRQYETLFPVESVMKHLKCPDCWLVDRRAARPDNEKVTAGLQAAVQILRQAERERRRAA